ncbi:MAG: RDD family protein [bacterium]
MTSSPRGIVRAFFCPQCGHPIRPTGPRCPECRAAVTLPPTVAPILASAAEDLVPIAGIVPPSVRRRQTYFLPDAWSLMGASVIDSCGAGSMAFPVLIFLRGDMVTFIGLWIAMIFLWQCAWIPALQGTPGMRLMGLRMIQTDSERPPDMVQSLLRTLGLLFPILTGGLSWLGMWVHPRRIAWHDQLAGVRVVRPRGDA